ncbi:DUF3558 domain-containing protein [Umezawaea endophytica]|uniref:DUF3558 domain-containing protein n=1 Tax=Umezawaea endophytica TaxID=1654476 RepID=A0A9X2VQQ1_9PSEU|nr:DUF3558 domain-containing protein [Umezawaea endophytica]MCS7480956.1 DUF3558 domain-containing protein [Umezawaea endophytica]
MSLSIRSACLIAALSLVVAGCSQERGGSPTPATGTGKSSSAPVESSTSAASPSSGSGNALVSFDSCKALTSIAGQFSLTEIEEVGKQECGAEYGADEGVSVSIKVWPDLGVQEATGGPNAESSDTTVGPRKAKLVKKAFSSSACLVAVEVSGKSRVDFLSSANVSLDKACDAATKIATAVEPSLPK